VAATSEAATLKELLDAADQQNLDRRISAEARARAAAESVQAWTALLPVFSAQAIWTHNQYFATFDRPRTVDMNGTMVPVLDESGKPIIDSLVIQPAQQYDAIFRFDVPLIDVSRWFRTAAASDAEGGAIEREEMTRDAVRRQVIGTYYSYAAATAVRE